ncbi:MAG: hypothetical protein P1U69_16525 [Parvibaculaceae bacterium]|nr:hypothetical protein [Parvibaculaceae bacterium]
MCVKRTESEIDYLTTLFIRSGGGLFAPVVVITFTLGAETPLGSFILPFWVGLPQGRDGADNAPLELRDKRRSNCL